MLSAFSVVPLKVLGLDGDLELLHREVAVRHHGQAVRMGVPRLLPQEQGIWHVKKEPNPYPKASWPSALWGTWKRGHT